MRIENRNFARPEDILNEAVDCIWIFARHAGEGNAYSKQFQALDWKMRGQLSRFLEAHDDYPTTFFPSMKKTLANYLVLQRSEAGIKSFIETGTGLALKKVLVLFEASQCEKNLLRELKQCTATFPESVLLVSPGASEIE